ncbi:glycoside hydrolase family 6 protein [Nocardioides sp.]|uniref:glycoside hydrolase family 6 protein n=1 Tax=Nocardioides sp. TaxID=35761 RepID=UPI002724B36B|nr:glycoside hydrolase family 6 protein [Nocardioides sp.]MDO9456296.1 glycoside hydrolase family 6 protein [Nocardioides sp.]
MRPRSPHVALVAATAATLLLSLAPSGGGASAAPAPGAPTAVDVDVRSGGAPAFAISWSDPAEGAPTSYEVLVDGKVRSTVEGAVHSAVVEGLSKGTSYKVAVRAVADGARSQGVGERLLLTYGAATPTLPANPTNPLAGQEWGVYLGPAEHSYDPWRNAEGETKAAIGEILLQPKAKWFGRWIPDDDIASKVGEYIRDTTHGDPDVMAQMTIFRMKPWEGDACKRLPTAAETASYKRYITSAAQAIGDTRMAVVLQPDGPFARCAPGGSKAPSRLIAWSARVLSALPRTQVYIDMGSPGWFRNDITDAVRMLVDAGVADTRGFALSITHMDTTRQSVNFGSRIVDALAARGITGKHFVVDTSDNGRGFSGKQFRKVYPRSIPINWAKMCRTPDQKLCVALGVPPTTDVANPRWGLPARINRLAAKNVDAYLWINRPWLYQQTVPFKVDYALALADQNPYG